MTTSFEHSSMKNSFSLSSLGAPAPPGCGEQNERPYHSLTKKRKEPTRSLWRRSWGSAASGGSVHDDLWPLLQHHYDYIMDNHLIDTCKEASGELSLPPTTQQLPPPCGYNRQWSLSRLVAEWSELCHWLWQVQHEIYASVENVASRKLRMTRMNELVSLEHRRAKFIEQANAILERIPEASSEVTWRVEHLNAKWEGLRLLLSPEQHQRNGENQDTVDTAHELRCLRRWLHGMEGRLPPPPLSARHHSPHHLATALAEHQVLQRDVECHGRIVSSVVRLCGGGDAARALERRWHLLYLRAIEWQCHLEACLARINNQSSLPLDPPSDSDDEPVHKQPRLSGRGSPRRVRTPVHGRRRDPSTDSRQSASEEEQDYVLTYQWRGFGSDCESELVRISRADVNMDTDKMVEQALERRVPGEEQGDDGGRDQIVPDAVDQIDGPGKQHIQVKTPPTVIKRKKPKDPSKFNQSERKSSNLGTYYYKHQDTDSDRNMMDNDKSQSESSEEEWTYVETPKIANEDSTDLMTSSIEIQTELPLDQKDPPKLKLESSTPDLLKDQNSRCNKDIERLVIQAEELVQKQAQQKMVKNKTYKNFKPLQFEEDGKNTKAKMSRIKEWLNQSSDGKNDSNQGQESYDASGEYTTESEVDASLTSEERNIHSSMDMSTSTCTVTPTHHAKVQLRKKRAGNSDRPWSVSCLSQLSRTAGPATPTCDVATMSHNMSISESALNTITAQIVTPANSNSKLRGSSTTVQGHVSSSNTMTEACASCAGADLDRSAALRRRRARRRHVPDIHRGERLVKSLSFSGWLSPKILVKNERSSAVSDPADSRKGGRFDTTSTSGNDSDEEHLKSQAATIAHLRKSIEKTHITPKDHENVEQNGNQSDQNLSAPTFKLGPAGGPVRHRLARSIERERSFLGLSLEPNEVWDVSVDKDSDVDKSGTGGTEEHSSFSEQAWDFYQEKYNSEPYSEAPDSDAARRLLEFGDDYRAFLDSQSDCCSSLSAQPENDISPNTRRKPSSPLKTLPRYKRNPLDTPSRKPKKSISSERRKSLLDSYERSRNNTSIESNDSRRRKPCEIKIAKKNEFDLLQALNRRRHSSNRTSDEINSSLEYSEVNNRPDIIDSLNRRRRNDSELQKIALSELRRRSTESVDSEEDSSPKKHSRRNWGEESDSESEEVRCLVRRSSGQLTVAEASLRADASPDLLRAFDYTEIIARCRENIILLEEALTGSPLSSALQRDIRAVSARWSALRVAATRRNSARRLRREIAALRETLKDVCEPDDCAPQPHTRAQLHRRIEELKERLSRLLDCKVAMLKLRVSVRRALGELESDDNGLAADLSTLLEEWDNAHQRTSTELLSLEKAVSAWAEWENALRELQGALRSDLATLQALQNRGDADQDEVAAQIRQLAASLVDKKKGGSTCDSLSDSGISDGDGEGSGRARRLSALRELARTLQQALAANSPAARIVDKRMEQTENDVRILQESCRLLVEHNMPELAVEDRKDSTSIIGNKTGSGDPDYTPRGGWVWRVLRSSLPIQLCLVALLLAAWLVERPRCCDALNSLAQTLTPQLRYVRGPPPV